MHAAGMKPDARDSERSHFIVQFQDCRLEAKKLDICQSHILQQVATYNTFIAVCMRAKDLD